MAQTVVRDSLEKLLRFLMKEENLGTLRNHGSWGLVFDTLEALVTTQDKMDAVSLNPESKQMVVPSTTPAVRPFL